jgi:hypothetical protein
VPASETPKFPRLNRLTVSIQSQVACGHVGNSAAVFPMQMHGIAACPFNQWVATPVRAGTAVAVLSFGRGVRTRS